MNRVLGTLSLAATLVAGATLAGCGGGGGTALPAAGGGGGAPLAAPGAIPFGANLARGASYLGRAQLATIGLDVHVALANEAGLYAYAKEANTPGSALYRKWLTPQELGEQFGATASDYAALVTAYTKAGISVKTYPQRTMLRLRGPQPAIERMLGLTFGIYKKNGQTFLAPTNAPHPLTLATKITALTGAVGYQARGRNYVRASNVFGNGYTPQQIASAFDYTSAYAAGYTGAGISVGIIGTGPITDGYPGTTGGDVLDFKHLYNVPGTGTVAQVFSTNADVATPSPGSPSPAPPVSGIPGEASTGLASPPPVTSGSTSACTSQGYSPGGGTFPTNYETCNPEDGEAQLDTEQVAGLAYDANVLFYLAFNPNECSGLPGPSCGATFSALGIQLTDDEIQQAIADDTADILSMSFGLDEADSEADYFPNGSTGPGPTEFAMAEAEGMAIFASSGDQGAQGCTAGTTQLCVSYPATDPSVVSVGGVNAPIDQSGQLSGPLTAWGTQTGGAANGQGSGGGCSLYFPLPAFQAGIPGETCSKRSQPDLSLDADTNTGVSVDIDAPPNLGGRELAVIGGTSVAAPDMAAMWALVLQACKQNSKCASSGAASAHAYRLGNPNPLLYQIYAKGLNGVGYANVFSDVQYGGNSTVPVPVSSSTPAPNATPTPVTGYTAGVGYDLTTGIGVPYARSLIRAVVGV